MKPKEEQLSKSHVKINGWSSEGKSDEAIMNHLDTSISCSTLNYQH